MLNNIHIEMRRSIRLGDGSVVMALHIFNSLVGCRRLQAQGCLVEMVETERQEDGVYHTTSDLLVWTNECKESFEFDNL